MNPINHIQYKYYFLKIRGGVVCKIYTGTLAFADFIHVYCSDIVVLWIPCNLVFDHI